MIQRLSTTCLCQPADLQPSRDDLEIVGTFNPGVIAFQDEVILLVRVAERPREQRAGYTALPRWQSGLGVVVDWIADAEIKRPDTRFIHRKSDDIVRLTFVSHLRVLHYRNGRLVDGENAIRFEPQGEFEEFGVEDARITRIGGTYWITYVAVSRHGPATALASTTDFQTFERHGVIFPIENKDVVLFPETIDGEYVALHRPIGKAPFTEPEVWLARSPNMIHWGQHDVLQGSDSAWCEGRVAAGTPPIRTPHGWLEICHGCTKPTPGSRVGTYAAGALLLDLDEPHRVVAKTSQPILVPENDFECEGFVPNMIVPTGIVDREETFLVYCGAADTACIVAELSKRDVFAAMR